MREPVAFALVLLVGFAACRCSSTPKPVPPVYVSVDGAAPVDACIPACANGYKFCPGSFPDGGADICTVECDGRLGRSPLFTAAIITCEGTATTAAAYVQCGGVTSCNP